LFFASLFLGSLLGQAFGQLFNLNPWGLAISPMDAALVGMAALSVSIVGGPMTLALLVLETTHDFALMGVVLTAALISATITREIFGYSFSTWRLHMRGSDIRSPRDIGWMLSLTARRIMRRDWTNVVATMSIAQFRATVSLGATSKAMVTDADGHYCGIVATAAAHAPGCDPHAQIGTLVTLAQTALTPASSLKTVLATFDTAMADELAVVTPEGYVAGIVTERHARRRYLEEIEAEQRNMFGETGR
jgi:CIC family chloride channel protein